MATMNLRFNQMYNSLELVANVSSVSYIPLLLGIIVFCAIVAQLRTIGSSDFEIPLEFVPYYPGHHGDAYQAVANFTFYTRRLKSSCYDVSLRLKFKSSKLVPDKKTTGPPVYIGLFLEAGRDSHAAMWSQDMAAESDTLNLPFMMKEFVREATPLDGLVTISIKNPEITLRSAYLQFEPRNSLITYIWRYLSGYLSYL